MSAHCYVISIEYDLAILCHLKHLFVGKMRIHRKTKVIPLFYKVEWLHNKRVITLSSTVFIDTIGRTKLECGVRILDEEQSATSCDVVPIGTTPAILPMHLLLRNIPLMLVVRPIDGLYSWSSDCILSYGALCS